MISKQLTLMITKKVPITKGIMTIGKFVIELSYKGWDYFFNVFHPCCGLPLG